MIGGIRPDKRCLTLTFRLSQESDVFWSSLPRSVLLGVRYNLHKARRCRLVSVDMRDRLG